MNCLEFRREMLFDPRLLGEEARAHASGCPACAQFRANALQMEDEIREGLEVPLPQGLEARLARRAKEGGAGRRRFLALAASLVLATGLGAGLYVAGRDDPLARAGIDFVIDQEVDAILRAKPADPAALWRTARALGVDIRAEGAEVRYIGTCPFQGTIAHHVVIMGESGKATLLLLPERPVERAGHAAARGLHAVVRPARAGSFAIIGDASFLERVQRTVVRS